MTGLRLRPIAIGILLALVIGVGLFSWLTLSYVYSEGERAGLAAEVLAQGLAVQDLRRRTGNVRGRRHSAGNLAVFGPRRKACRPAGEPGRSPRAAALYGASGRAVVLLCRHALFRRPRHLDRRFSASNAALGSCDTGEPSFERAALKKKRPPKRPFASGAR